MIRDGTHSVIIWLRVLFVVSHNIKNKLCSICFEDVAVENIFEHYIRLPENFTVGTVLRGYEKVRLTGRTANELRLEF